MELDHETLLRRPNYREAEYCELEKLCPKCKEWWPADEEFFYKQGNGLSSWCRACYNHWRQDRRRRGIADYGGRVISKETCP